MKTTHGLHVIHSHSGHGRTKQKLEKKKESHVAESKSTQFGVLGEFLRLAPFCGAGIIAGWWRSA